MGSGCGIMRTVTIELPDEVYKELEARAKERQRTVEAELVQVVSKAVPVGEKIASELEAKIEKLQSLDNESLLKTVKPTMSKRSSQRLANLNYKRQSEGLTSDEENEAAKLLTQYEHSILIRAHVLKLLKERGYDLDKIIGEK
jgi:plasmid stability protein